MKKVQIATLALLFNGEKGTTEAKKIMPLKRGEIVTLEVVDNLSSDNLAIGDVVRLIVSKPVVGDEGYVLINRGAYAEAIVRDVQRAKGYGRGGLIVLEPVNIETFDKRRIPLKSNGLLIAEGQERRGLAWSITILSIGVAAVVGVATLGATGVMGGVPFVAVGGLIHGRDAKFFSGKTMSATIMEDRNVETDPKLTTH
jgi:hypothetical protein